MQKFEIQAFKNEDFRKWSGAKTALANYEMKFLEHFEWGDFQYASLNYKAINYNVLNIALTAAALNDQFDFIRSFLNFKNEKKVTAKFWNELYRHFPDTYKDAAGYYTKTDLTKLCRDCISELNVNLLEDILKRHPEIEQDDKVSNYFSHVNEIMRHTALMEGNRDLYNRLLKYQGDFGKDTKLPAFLKADLKFLGSKSKQDLTPHRQQDVWNIVLDHVHAGWDMSYALTVCESIRPLMNYGYRFEDFEKENTKSLIAKRQMNELFQMKQTFNDMAKDKRFREIIEETCKNDNGTYDFTAIAGEDFNGLSALEIITRHKSLPKILNLKTAGAELDKIAKLLPPHVAKSQAKYFAELRQQYKMDLLKKRTPAKKPLKRRI